MSNSEETDLATILYFKSSGKYYTEGVGKIPKARWYGSITRNTILKYNNGAFPGLSTFDTKDFIIVMIGTEAPADSRFVPIVLLPETTSNAPTGEI